MTNITSSLRSLNLKHKPSNLRICYLNDKLTSNAHIRVQLFPITAGLATFEAVSWAGRMQ